MVRQEQDYFPTDLTYLIKHVTPSILLTLRLFSATRNNYDNFQGHSEAIPIARQLEIYRNFHHWYYSRRLSGNNVRVGLLDHARYKFFHDDGSRLADDNLVP